MYRTVFLSAAVLAVTSGARSPNADVIEDLIKTPQWSRYSNNILQDALLDAPSLISKYRYPVEIHHVVTADGYILAAHRIPHGRDRNNQPDGNKPVVFIMHGLLSSSADFLVLGPGSALAYLLAEEGYDVWLGNARGNYYSRRHTTLDPDDRTNDFWRFSWEQIGLYDISAFIDYILRTSGQSRVHYIGHSQGGTAFLVLNSLRTEYNEKFISFQGLAPAAYFDNNDNSALNFLARYEKLIEAGFFTLGFGEILRNSEFTTWIAITFCSQQSLFHPLCADVFSVFGGNEKINSTMIPVFLGHTPAGSSIRQVAHYGQSIRRHAFARFDYNSITNLRLYGSPTPPEFNVSRITVPAYLHYGLSDREVDYRDLHVLAEKLGNTVGTYRAERESFNHFDFVWGGDVKAEIFDRVFELIRSAEKRN